MLNLTDLAQNCAKETDRFFRGQEYDPQHCFELFRRAIMERDGPAWESLFSQYRALVGRWVQSHPGFGATGEEVDYFINRAFEKIWAALTPDRFRNFSELGALLRYLKTCVHSVISDHNRSVALAELYSLTEETGHQEKGASPHSFEDWALEQVHRQAFWELLQTRLHDEKERQVIYGSFVLALKPREVYDQCQPLFDSVDEVYLIKQNVLARFRRDAEFAELLKRRD